MQDRHRVLTVTRGGLAVVVAGLTAAPALSILVLGVLALLGVALLGGLVLLGGLLFCRRSAPAQRLQRLLENVRSRDLGREAHTSEEESRSEG
jgi:hypothetical protein